MTAILPHARSAVTDRHSMIALRVRRRGGQPTA
jgi:hypothetical protein